MPRHTRTRVAASEGSSRSVDTSQSMFESIAEGCVWRAMESDLASLGHSGHPWELIITVVTKAISHEFLDLRESGF